ncbi:hypothetical protein A6R68_13978 [Neotoma lepida]|uniref:Uncharacterized protein n=1 Tax=Neotoma lepida TaxID=56216 RepID=A0A1A6HAY4_NEOLE|nr:hypothetical protein A6R68_13978 [Neotoma lepida]
MRNSYTGEARQRKAHVTQCKPKSKGNSNTHALMMLGNADSCQTNPECHQQTMIYHRASRKTKEMS